MPNTYRGLTTNQAKELLQQYGPNQLISVQSNRIMAVFLSQFINLLTVLLLLSAVIALALHDYIEGIFILLIVALDGILGFIQEYKSEKALEKLKIFSITTTRVRRDGLDQSIDSRLLVPGDIIILEEGSKVPADSIVIDSLNLEVDEAVLTGESLPVLKTHEDSTAHTIFMGTIIVKGRCVARVTQTGMHTQYGKVAQSLSSVKTDQTPLEKRLSHLSTQLAIIGIGGSSFVFVVGTLRNLGLFESLLTSISLAVATVPEGLPAVVTITLAVGVNRMTRRRAIVRRLATIESLGATTVIVSDKTGTLTKNEMRVRRVWIHDQSLIPSTLGDRLDPALTKLLEISSLCNTASLLFTHDHDKFEIIGHQTEGSLLLLCHQAGKNPDDLRAQAKIIDEFSFDTQTHSMTVIIAHGKQYTALTKGSPESILAKSSSYLTASEIKLLTPAEKQHIEESYRQFAQDGLRLIAFGYKDLSSYQQRSKREEVETNLIFVGFVGIADPPREEVKAALEKTRLAGISTVMVTGDNELTADRIASEIGLISQGEKIITGKQLDEMDDTTLDSLLPSVRIFARTTPFHKLRIVQSYKRLGHTVAVTGDGVNDALALKQADVGVAMGITGTDVSREAADLVITDDNFATIVEAIEEGRIIFDNIAKSVLYLVTGNLSEILTVVLSVIVGLPTPLVPVQILWMNLVTDGLPALALAIDPKDPLVMRRQPKPVHEQIITSKDGFWATKYALLITIVTVCLYVAFLTFTNLILARTVAFSTIILLQMLLAFLVRKNHSIHSNRYLLYAVAGSILCQVIIVFVPFFHPIFQVGIK